MFGRSQKGVVLPKVRCGHCGYEWTPRKNGLPAYCPECHRVNRAELVTASRVRQA